MLNPPADSARLEGTEITPALHEHYHHTSSSRADVIQYNYRQGKARGKKKKQTKNPEDEPDGTRGRHPVGSTGSGSTAPGTMHTCGAGKRGYLRGHRS